MCDGEQRPKRGFCYGKDCYITECKNDFYVAHDGPITCWNYLINVKVYFPPFTPCLLTEKLQAAS